MLISLIVIFYNYWKESSKPTVMAINKILPPAIIAGIFHAGHSATLHTRLLILFPYRGSSGLEQKVGLMNVSLRESLTQILQI